MFEGVWTCWTTLLALQWQKTEFLVGIITQFLLDIVCLSTYLRRVGGDHAKRHTKGANSKWFQGVALLMLEYPHGENLTPCYI